MPRFSPNMPTFVTSHDVLKPLKQAFSASPDAIISGQVCGSKLQRVFTLGDGCWLPSFGKRSEDPRILLSAAPLKSLENEGENARISKENRAKRKKTRKTKKARIGRSRQGGSTQLSGPVSRDIAILPLRYPISCDISFSSEQEIHPKTKKISEREREIYIYIYKFSFFEQFALGS